MTDFIPTERATSIRMPSTAILAIDSADRNTTNYPNPYNFTIQQKQSILNGFFTRVGATEVALNWNQPNISSALNNDAVNFVANGVTKKIYVPDGFYTAYELLQVLALDASGSYGGTNVNFTVGTKQVPNGGEVYFTESPADWFIESNDVNFSITAVSGNSLFNNLNIIFNDDTPSVLGGTPDLRYTRYVDFVSPSLTYCQKLKDGNSSSATRDVLCRFYFANDTPQFDAGGLLQYVGYTPFNIWRQFNPPKQIKFDPNLPIGQLQFQVYDSNGNLIPNLTLASNGYKSTDWQMTLQVSEV